MFGQFGAVDLVVGETDYILPIMRHLYFGYGFRVFERVKLLPFFLMVAIALKIVIASSA